MLRIVLTALLIGVLTPLATPVAANPYAAALTVNGRVITNYDIEQRIALLDSLGATGDVEELAVQQLTEDRLKLLAGDELGIELPENAPQIGLEEFAFRLRRRYHREQAQGPGNQFLVHASIQARYSFRPVVIGSAMTSGSS